MNNLDKAKFNFLIKESTLSEYASLSADAIRLKEIDEDMKRLGLRK